MNRRVTLYEREGCHLCEQPRQLTDALIGPDRYERVDIDASDDLVLSYGFRVPVVAVDGVDRLEAPMTANEVRGCLRRSAEGLQDLVLLAVQPPDELVQNDVREVGILLHERRELPGRQQEAFRLHERLDRCAPRA